MGHGEDSDRSTQPGVPLRMPDQAVVDRVQGAAAAFEAQTLDPEELHRLRSFYDRMKRAGIATTREYDLPQLDTIGRSILRKRQPE